MPQKTLSNPTVQIDGDGIAIIPNSLSYKTGSGDKDVKAQSAGGGIIEVVVTENAETNLSTIKFKLYNTATNLQYVKDWSDSPSVTIAISEGGIQEQFAECVVTAEPERSIGADGELEIEFKGAPSI